MKKAFISLTILLGTVSSSYAEPYLITDPQDPNVVKSYDLTIDGTTVNVAPTVVDDKVILKYDLADLTEGEHTATIIAKGIWGQSNPVSYTFSKIIPADVTGIMVCKSGNVSITVGDNDAIIVKCND